MEGHRSRTALADRAARRFPLVPRPRPSCPPIQTRVRQITDRSAHTESAAAALNLAALAASDTGMGDLARELCLRQARIHAPVTSADVDTAKLALQPLINLARLRIRAGRGDVAYALLEHLFTAAKDRSTAVVETVEINFETLTARRIDREEIARWLWTVLLSDGTRALATAGRWREAHEHARRHRAIGDRLLDGRQIAILAHSADGDHDGALTLLTESEAPETWESAVTAVLEVLCLQRAGRRSPSAVAKMADAFCSLPEWDEEVFATRLGLCVAEMAVEESGRARAVAALTERATATEDAYVAQDLLKHPDNRERLPTAVVERLERLVHRAALGVGRLPEDLHAELMRAVCESEKHLYEKAALA